MKYYKKKIAKCKTITLQQLYGIQPDKKTTTERTKVGGNDNSIQILEEEVRRLQEWKEDF